MSHFQHLYLHFQLRKYRKWQLSLHCFSKCNFFSADTSADVSATFSSRFAERMLKVGGGVLILKESQNWQPGWLCEPQTADYPHRPELHQQSHLRKSDISKVISIQCRYISTFSIRKKVAKVVPAETAETGLQKAEGTTLQFYFGLLKLQKLLLIVSQLFAKISADT